MIPRTLALLVLVPAAAFADPATRVFLNGMPTPVYFNDGDSFRILGGPHAGVKTRLSGYNTLESFGPVHSWGDFTPFELYVTAKKATLNARRGTWHCTGDGRKDGYGRMLWDCPDLRLNQVRKGFAHAYSVDDNVAAPDLLAAQREAQEQRRGLWAHGVPEVIVTSVHSADEDPTKQFHYNRTISTVDGRTVEWKHSDVYAECEKVCRELERVSPDAAMEAASVILPDAVIGPKLGDYSRLALSRVISDYVRTGQLTKSIRDDVRPDLDARLGAMRDAGKFNAVERVKAACMVHVEMKHWFGLGRAACLAKH